jgi:hypothetical protein
MQFSGFICMGESNLSGGYSEEDPPVPIPNTVVKLFCADDTGLETVLENRTLPDPSYAKAPLA